ncbi:ATP-binding cassette subfamily B protein/ATP-binding cassette subfamily C protein/ATP-binding cassette subfamily B multidrug efflux pump [Pelomonas saccharophila]|uniref:ATP-binding cassette subfamily B protein/ATP-binding cassette subfamily C protein/ATP-binding cassette subfamily B multidrug efflux pump n=1 Tax=Roseateles saccharophilus TaxID=304 RepID=A0ABU1YJW2_ROSSA|nr:ABC transporter transmembrane domain-containing protein [Roseateles saccharophilus]MDR7269147.1 ATP-binding cassette subfamily B protein/ATP-binding cassette subfamily C protein/ATP-binding cassette subfamily B multidrug efflux pump [Roseateles saccharophilus]
MSAAPLPSPTSLSRMLAAFVREHWRAYAAAGAMLSCIAAMTVWIPRQVGHVVDALVAGGLRGDALLRQLGLLVLAGLAIYLLRVGWRLTLFKAAFHLGARLRTRLYARLALQGPAYFQSQRTGDLMALATNDIDTVEQAAGEAMLAGFDGTQTLVLVLAMMTLGIDWRLGLAALLPFPLMALAFWWISNHLHQAAQDSLTRFGDLNQQVQESLSGVRTVRALGLVARSEKQFSDLAERAAEASFRSQRWEAAYEPAVGMTLSAATAIALAMGGWLVSRSEISIGQLTAFTMYLGQLIWPMFAAGWVLALLERGRAAWTRLAPVLDAPLTLADNGHAALPADVTLRSEALTFSFPGAKRPALEGVDLTLAPGRTLGIVGATGAGKSTLVRLLLRQAEPQAGRMTLGGVALPELPLATLRAHIAWVPQEPFLFSASVADNIALARPGASREEVEAAARLAAVHDDIARLPEGYATEVGERGVTLSGGQRQRVAIARALLSDAPLLVLDDALSAVDTGTETDILDHLRELRSARPDRSVIVIAHRLSAVMDADEVIVLKQGHVIERGTHAELLALGGWYAAQWRYQQIEASLEAA